VNNIRTTTLLVIAICTAVLSTDAEAASPYVYKVEDPADFLVGDPVYSGPQPGEKLRGSPLFLPEETGKMTNLIQWPSGWANRTS
jgi:hypothetical protein